MGIPDIPGDIFSVLFRWVFSHEDFVDSRVRCHDDDAASLLITGKPVEMMEVAVDDVFSVVT